MPKSEEIIRDMKDKERVVAKYLREQERGENAAKKRAGGKDPLQFAQEAIRARNVRAPKEGIGGTDVIAEPETTKTKEMKRQVREEMLEQDKKVSTFMKGMFRAEGD